MREATAEQEKLSALAALLPLAREEKQQMLKVAKLAEAKTIEADKAKKATKEAILALPAAIRIEQAAAAEMTKTTEAAQAAQSVRIARSTAATKASELAIAALAASQSKLAEASLAMIPVRNHLLGSLEKPYSRDQMKVALAVQNIFMEKLDIAKAKSYLVLANISEFCDDFHRKIYQNVLKPYHSEANNSPFEAWWHHYRGNQLETLQDHHSRFNHALQIIRDNLLPLKHIPNSYFKEQLITINACLLVNLRQMYKAMPWHKTVGVLFVEMYPDSKDVLKETPDKQFHFMSDEGQVVVAASDAVAANTRAKAAEDRAIAAEVGTTTAKAESAAAKAETAAAKAESVAAKAETAAAKSEMARMTIQLKDFMAAVGVQEAVHAGRLAPVPPSPLASVAQLGLFVPHQSTNLSGAMPIRISNSQP